MTKQLLLFITLVSFSSLCTAQSISINAVQNSAGNSTSTYSLAAGKVSFSSGSIRFLKNNKTVGNYLAYGISRDHAIVGYLQGGDSKSTVSLMSSSGESYSTFDIYELTTGDPSIAIYPANSGDVLVRDNIANFNYYDTYGELVARLSGSSQSKGGESISEAAMSPAAETIVLYTPKIRRDGELGSQAQYVDQGMSLQSLFFSTGRFIKTLEVSSDGQFVIFITAREGSNDRIHVTDRFGNEISSISTDENLKGAKLSEQADIISAYSGRRVLVFDALSGERIAGTSFRTEVQTVNYFTEDNTILAMTGNLDDNAGIVSDIDFHAIDIEQRKVERQPYPSSLGFNEALNQQFIRLGTNRYLLEGASRKLEISVSY